MDQNSEGTLSPSRVLYPPNHQSNMKANESIFKHVSYQKKLTSHPAILRMLLENVLYY